MTNVTNASNNATLDSSVSRVYAFCGVFLILAGMLLGDIFAVFILHPNNGRIGEAIYLAAMAIPAGDVDAIMGHFQSVGGFLENRGTKVDAHSHGVAVGYIAVILAFLQPSVAFSTDTKRRLAWVYVVCALALPVSIFTIHYAGLAYSPFAYIGWASVAADAAGLTLGILIVLQLIGVCRDDGGGASAFQQSIGDSGRVLLLGSAILILAGFLYGAGYAAYVEYLMQANEVEILKGIVANAAAGPSVDSDFAAYGAYLAFRGLNAAAHAHVNTMAILLLIAALVQPYVLLSACWKKRWALLLVFGAFALPTFILLEFKFGLLAGGFADTSGLLAMLALGAMLVGMTRRTAVTDNAGAG